MKKIVFPIILIIISGALIFTFVVPNYKEVNVLNKDIGIYKTALADSVELQQTHDALFETYKNIPSPYREKLNKLLPNTVNNIKFILEVEQIASRYNMPVKNIKFDPKKAEEEENVNPRGVMIISDKDKILPYGVFPIEFTVSGSYSSFVMFIKDLEENLRVADVKSISFKTLPDNKTQFISDLHDFNIKLETYWLK